MRARSRKSRAIADELRALKRESAIVYCGTRKRREVTDFLQRSGVVRPLPRRHGGRWRPQSASGMPSPAIPFASSSPPTPSAWVSTSPMSHGHPPRHARLAESTTRGSWPRRRDGLNPPTLHPLLARPLAPRCFIEMAPPEANARRRGLPRARLLPAGGRTHPCPRTHARTTSPASTPPSDAGPGVWSQPPHRGWRIERHPHLILATDIDTAGLRRPPPELFASPSSRHEDYARSRTCLRARISPISRRYRARAACGNCAPCTAGTLTSRRDSRRHRRGRPLPAAPRRKSRRDS